MVGWGGGRSECMLSAGLCVDRLSRTHAHPRSIDNISSDDESIDLRPEVIRTGGRCATQFFVDVSAAPKPLRPTRLLTRTGGHLSTSPKTFSVCAGVHDRSLLRLLTALLPSSMSNMRPPLAVDAVDLHATRRACRCICCVVISRSPSQYGGVFATMPARTDLRPYLISDRNQELSAINVAYTYIRTAPSDRVETNALLNNTVLI